MEKKSLSILKYSEVLGSHMFYKLLNEMFSFSSALERQNAILYLWDIILGYIMQVSSNIGYIGFIFLKQNWVLRAHILLCPVVSNIFLSYIHLLLQL